MGNKTPFRWGLPKQVLTKIITPCCLKEPSTFSYELQKHVPSEKQHMDFKPHHYKQDIAAMQVNSLKIQNEPFL